MFAGERRRRRGLHAFFTSQLRRQYLPYGHVYTTDRMDGAAMWGPPERQRQERAQGAVPTAARPHRSCRPAADPGPAAAVRGGRALHPKEPHWYLATIGTEPDRQGTRESGRPCCSRCSTAIDEAGAPAYLESSKERNVPLLRPVRVRGDRRAPLGGGEPAHLAHVARAPGPGGLSRRSPTALRGGGRVSRRRRRRRAGPRARATTASAARAGHGSAPTGSPRLRWATPDPATGQAFDGDRVELGRQEGGNGRGRAGWPARTPRR